ncbi:MAG: hypothetical protein H0T70_09810 [Acidimicrobiia bacterium]|nr:hypothetical protein [Acidimicrobiia bacterium]
MKRAYPWGASVACPCGSGDGRLTIDTYNSSDLRAVQAFAGHSRPEVTSGYTRAKDTALRKVVDALDY